MHKSKTSHRTAVPRVTKVKLFVKVIFLMLTTYLTNGALVLALEWGLDVLAFGLEGPAPLPLGLSLKTMGKKLSRFTENAWVNTQARWTHYAYLQSTWIHLICVEFDNILKHRRNYSRGFKQHIANFWHTHPFSTPIKLLVSSCETESALTLF